MISVRAIEKKTNDPQFLSALSADPKATLEAFAEEYKVTSDPFVYRVVVLALGGVGLIGIGGALWLALVGGQVPDAVVALASASIGALAGLLAPSPASSKS